MKPRKLFQFTPLREGRPKSPIGVLTVSYFNSRPYVRGDPFKVGVIVYDIDFNSRPYVRGDFVQCIYGCDLKLFQFTPLREGRRKC